MQHFTSVFLKFEPNLLVKTALFLVKAVFAMAILDLISRTPLVNLLSCNPNSLKLAKVLEFCNTTSWPCVL